MKYPPPPPSYEVQNTGMARAGSQQAVPTQAEGARPGLGGLGVAPPLIR